MADALDFKALLDEVLVASEEALDTIPGFDPTLEGAPAQAYVSGWLPPLDCCDQLTVHSPGVVEAVTERTLLREGRKIASARINHVGIIVTITRCIPSPDTQGVMDIAAADHASAQILADGWALWNHIWNLWASDQLFTLCGEVFFDGLRPVPPLGGCAGWTLNLRVRLDGYTD